MPRLALKQAVLTNESLRAACRKVAELVAPFADPESMTTWLSTSLDVFEDLHSSLNHFRDLSGTLRTCQSL